MSLEEYLNHDEPHRFMIDEQVPWQDIISKKSKARRKAGSKRAKKKVRRNRKSDKKRDACYYKVRSRYEKWPSAYASGALVQCRKVGASNWGESTKKSWEDTIKGGDNFAREKDEGLHGWFKRRGGKESKGGKTQRGWIDCGTVGDKGGPKPCGRKDASKGRKRRCRPTPAACKTYKRRKGSP